MKNDVFSYDSSVVEGFDAEVLLGVVRDARFEQRLMAPGHFRAHLQRLIFPHFSLDSGTYSLPIFASGSFGRGVVALALALSCKEPMWANGRQVAAGQIMVFAEDSELNVRPGPGGWHWTVLLIDRDVLQEAAIERLGHVLPIPNSGWCCRNTPPHRARALCDAVHAALGTAARRNARVDQEGIAAQESLLLGAFMDAVDEGPESKSLSREDWMVRRRDQIVRKAECFLRAELGRPFDSRALSIRLGIGERRVQRLFQDAYGLGPCRWHQIARLNAARNALLRAEKCGKVTEIAMGFGFGHLGRFSSEYREVFGEYPRDTLLRS